MRASASLFILSLDGGISPLAGWLRYVVSALLRLLKAYWDGMAL